MATHISNDSGSNFIVAEGGDGDVQIMETNSAGYVMYPPGAALIDAIREELGLPTEAPDIFLDLPDVKPDYDGEYPVPITYLSNPEQARATARYAYAAYLRLTTVDPATVTALAEVLRNLGGETPEIQARNLLLNETVHVTVDLPS